jgi:hypothetical protein
MLKPVVVVAAVVVEIVVLQILVAAAVAQVKEVIRELDQIMVMVVLEVVV